MKHYSIKNKQIVNEFLLLTLQPKRKRDIINYQAGQYATLGFMAKNGRPSPMRSFSIVSSPHSSNNLEFAIKIVGDFTQALAEQQIGDQIFLLGPFGEFVLDSRYDRNVILLAGGIGITPIISIIRAATDSNLSIPMTLLYSCRNLDNALFYDELRELEKINPRFRMLLFLTDKQQTVRERGILSGKISESRIDQLVGGRYKRLTFFLCGSINFMDGLETILNKHQVEKDQIVSESFSAISKVTLGDGYSIQKLTYSLTLAVMVVGFLGIAVMDLFEYIPRYNQSIALVSSGSKTTSTQNQRAYDIYYYGQRLQGNPIKSNQNSYKTPLTSVS